MSQSQSLEFSRILPAPPQYEVYLGKDIQRGDRLSKRFAETRHFPEFNGSKDIPVVLNVWIEDHPSIDAIWKHEKVTAKKLRKAKAAAKKSGLESTENFAEDAKTLEIELAHISKKRKAVEESFDEHLAKLQSRFIGNSVILLNRPAWGMACCESSPPGRLQYLVPFSWSEESGQGILTVDAFDSTSKAALRDLSLPNTGTEKLVPESGILLTFGGPPDGKGFEKWSSGIENVSRSPVSMNSFDVDSLYRILHQIKLRKEESQKKIFYLLMAVFVGMLVLLAWTIHYLFPLPRIEDGLPATWAIWLEPLTRPFTDLMVLAVFAVFLFITFRWEWQKFVNWLWARAFKVADFVSSLPLVVCKELQKWSEAISLWIPSEALNYTQEIAKAVAKVNSERVELLLDHPIENADKDQLELHGYPRMLANAIRNNSGCQTFAINARWGFGKTSLMKQVKSILDRDPLFRTPWVLAWHYEESDKPVLSIVSAIIREIKRAEKKDEFFDEVLQILSRLSESEIGGTLLMNLKIKFMSRRSQAEMTQDDCQKCKEGLCHLSAKCDRRRIVVFIDDLDRCDPDKAIKILESIKVIFDQELFSFVLAIDRVALENHLFKKFKAQGATFGEAESAEMAKTYLDKIIQTEFDYPVVKEKFPSYIDKTARNKKCGPMKNMDNESRNLEALRDLYVCHWTTPGKKPAIGNRDGTKLVADSVDRARADNRLKKYVAMAVNYNPRQFKRLVNRLRVEEDLVEHHSGADLILPLHDLVEERKDYFKIADRVCSLEQACSLAGETIPDLETEVICDTVKTLRIIHMATMVAIRPVLSDLNIEALPQERRRGLIPTPFSVVRYYIEGGSLDSHHIAAHLKVLQRLAPLREECEKQGSIAAGWLKEVEIMKLMQRVDRVTQPEEIEGAGDEAILKTALRTQLGFDFAIDLEKITEDLIPPGKDTIDLADTAFSNLSLLGKLPRFVKCLGLSKTMVTEKSDWEVVYSFNLLEKLFLNNIGLPKLPVPRNEGCLPNLTMLDVSDTQINSLPDGLALNLKCLDISGAQFDDFQFLESRRDVSIVRGDLANLAAIISKADFDEPDEQGGNNGKDRQEGQTELPVGRTLTIRLRRGTAEPKVRKRIEDILKKFEVSLVIWEDLKRPEEYE